ncbi:RICIN domain-containing protein [Kitasatospora sp. RG8]|uniref:RICIN domain-containing protein n=1 Tax=Kitasatospora sp. RG8 TaxID=2820815 RepID=UPI001AE0CDDF|nr:RICIN domain-containing protein [Kitasatospora sp. RG8]MBP0454166.1 RICIN domain-containing protein [Kitasatospora sp. RG8]
MKTAIRLTGTVLASLALLAGTAGTGQAARVNMTIRNTNSGRCLSVPAASTEFAYLNQFHCGVYVDQVWNLVYAGESGGKAWYKIVNVNSGLCLSVDAASQDDWALITQYPCGTPLYPDQYWRFEDTDPRTGGDHVRNRNSNKCLAIADGSTAEAASAIQYSCGSWNDHYWKAIPQ